MKTHRELDVWKLAMEFVTRVYKVTKDFPKEEIYGLVAQLRRSAVSIPSNIGEGAARSSTKDYSRFLYMALGSASEIDVQLRISRNLEYLSENLFLELNEVREQISRMLSGLISSLNRRNRR